MISNLPQLMLIEVECTKLVDLGQYAWDKKICENTNETCEYADLKTIGGFIKEGTIQWEPALTWVDSDLCCFDYRTPSTTNDVIIKTN